MKLNDEEFASLRARAEELGVSLPRFLVESATAGGVQTETERHALYAELLMLRKLLGDLVRDVRRGAADERTGPGADIREPADATDPTDPTAAIARRVDDVCARVDVVTAGLTRSIPGLAEGTA